MNIPEIRFPDFNGGWKSIRLGDIGRFSKGKGISKGDISEHGETDCIRYGELYTRYNETIEHAHSKTNIDKRELVLSEENDIIIPSSGETQIDIATASCVLKSGIALGGDLNIIKTNSNGVFLSYYLNSKKKIDIAKLSQGISVVHLYSSQLSTLSLNLPTFSEQQKIASFFTAIDHRISQLKQKKTLLERYKKGVMQKIFSQEIRFRDDNGKEFPRWENKRFNQIYSFRVTNSFSRDNLTYDTGEVKNIHYGDIHTKFPTLLDITTVEVPYVNPDIPLEKISDDNYCKPNDLVFADASEDVPVVGKCIELVNLNDEKVLAGLHTILARPNIDKVAKGFGGYLMKSIDVRKQIMKISQGSKVTSISSTRLCDIDLNIPCPTEQLKIADFFSAID
ncbi:MAG: restriction endonuclease subunit S, partial [Bacteroidales bacterium]|nr:restriction endonuclease subunit S [Bacteroidales bacterium]